MGYKKPIKAMATSCSIIPRRQHLPRLSGNANVSNPTSGAHAERLSNDLKQLPELFDRLLILSNQARALEAAKVLHRIEQVLEHNRHAIDRDPEVAALQTMLRTEYRPLAQKIKEQAAEVTDALEDLTGGSDWQHGATLFGVETSYKMGHEGSIWVKLDGEIQDLPLFEQLAVLKEVDLYRLWAPFCDRSDLLHTYSLADMVLHFNIAVPFLSRDCILRAYAADCTYENGCVVLLARSVKEFQGQSAKHLKKSISQDQMTLHGMRAYMHLLSPTRAKTTIIVNVDPNTPLPRSLVNFVMRNVAGVLLHCIQKQAQKVLMNPNSEHAHRIREEHPVYVLWLLPKLLDYCYYRGWGFPCVTMLGMHLTTLPADVLDKLQLDPFGVDGESELSQHCVVDGLCTRCQQPVYRKIAAETLGHIIPVLLASPYAARSISRQEIKPKISLRRLPTPAHISEGNDQLQRKTRASTLKRKISRIFKPRNSEPVIEHTEPVKEVSPYLQKRFLEWKSRKRVFQRVELRSGWGDFMVDWIAWPVIAFVPLLLAYDTAFMEWLHIPNGYLCTMAVFGAIHTFVLLVAGLVGIKGVQSLLDRRLRTLSGTESFALKLIFILGMVLTLLATMIGGIVASYRAEGPSLEAWRVAWEGIALGLGRGMLSMSTCFVSLAIFTFHTLLRFSPSQDIEVANLPRATAVRAPYEVDVIDSTPN